MSNTEILIADGNTARAERVAEVLESAGHHCSLASHGAAALELALAKEPGVVVAQVNLSLVDAGNLAEILRANPRTRAVHFLFLGAASVGDPLGGIGDLTLPATAELDVVLEAVASLIDRQHRIDRFEARASTALEFSGALTEISPAELLQILHLRGATGRVTFEPDQPGIASTLGEVTLQDGEICAAEIGSIRAEKALFRMLEWCVGCFEFKPEDLEGGPEITAPTRSVLVEGLRQLEEWKRLASKLPPLDSRLRLLIDRGELPKVVHPLTQEVLGLLEDLARVSDVLDACRYTDYQVLRTLYTLSERGIVEFCREEVAPSQLRNRVALFNEAQCRRLRGFAQMGLARDIEAPDAKLLVVAASQLGLRRFASLLTKVPGVEVSARFERGEVGASPLETMARVDVDAGFRIDLIHLPAEQTYAPLRELAAHAALGTIILLDAELGESTARLSPITGTLADVPGARTFHAVILGEEERLSPQELRENLSLIDKASLFLLPTSSSKDPESLLRSLFARIVP